MDSFLSVNLSIKEQIRIFRHILIKKRHGCWKWVGAKDQRGYGLLYFRGRTERIHRIMYAWKKGMIPRGIAARKEQIDHLCNNPECCNPKHLKLTSHKENVLRGNGPSAKNAKKKFCIHGHPLKITQRGRRDCPTCDSIRHKKRITGPDREYWLKKAREATYRFYHKNK